jgi:hypothetical protein
MTRTRSSVILIIAALLAVFGRMGLAAQAATPFSERVGRSMSEFVRY